MEIGWTVTLDDDLVEAARSVAAELFGLEPAVAAVSERAWRVLRAFERRTPRLERAGEPPEVADGLLALVMHESGISGMYDALGDLQRHLVSVDDGVAEGLPAWRKAAEEEGDERVSKPGELIQRLVHALR